MKKVITICKMQWNGDIRNDDIEVINASPTTRIQCSNRSIESTKDLIAMYTACDGKEEKDKEETKHAVNKEIREKKGKSRPHKQLQKFKTR